MLSYFCLNSSPLEHQRCADVEVVEAELAVTNLRRDIALVDIDNTVLKANEEMALTPQLNAEVIVQTEVKTLMSGTKDISLNLNAIDLGYILTQDTKSKIGTYARCK